MRKFYPKSQKYLIRRVSKPKEPVRSEDCGGAWGYMEFLEAIQNPNHPEHESYLEWVGGSFDSEFCDLKEVNQRLAEFESFTQQEF